MKRILILTIFILTLSFLSQAKSNKRGVSENNFQYWAQIEALAPGVTWYYNWGNTPGSKFETNEYMEYVPMVWSGSYSADNIRNFCKNNPNIKYLLGFNEPNFKSQANMTPSQAAEAWPAVQALAKELNLELVAPVLNYSPDAPYNDPLKWMDEFVALVGKDAFDYTAIHSYGGNGVVKDLATKFHDRYGKDVWVTEFCFWPDEGNKNSVVSPEKQIEDMMYTIEWLEKTEWIFRYSWFKAIGDSNSSTGPNYGLLISGRGEDPRELSEQGKVYLNLSKFDFKEFYPINKELAASNYIAQNNCRLGGSNDPQNTTTIEINKFNSGATLDYQFDVPKTGEYNLVLRVSGKGEPERFDPNIGVVGVNADGLDGEVLSSNKSFGLSNDDSKYQNVIFPMNLKAGKQTIRLKDYAPYQPSGIRISSITLADAAGVNEISAIDSNKPVNVYNLQGICVLKNVKPEEISNLLSKGIYVIEGHKIAIP